MESVAYNDIAKILGGSKVFGISRWTSVSWMKQIEKGFPFLALEHIKETLDLKDDDLSQILEVSTKTTSRWRRQDIPRLPVPVSDRIYRFARLFALAEQVLEDKVAAREWLHDGQIGLGGRTPIDMMRTEAGAREVESLLVRIEHGVLS